jgi:hypothetical protein
MGGVVAIYRLLANAAFDPDKVRVMIEAYECACRELELSGDRTDQLTELVAKKIIEIAQAEIKADPQFICRQSLQELGISKH